MHTQSRIHVRGGPEARELLLFLSSLSSLSSATTSLTPVESLSHADIIVYHGQGNLGLYAPMPVHAFGKWPPILSRDSSPSKSPRFKPSCVYDLYVLSRADIATVEDACGTLSKGDGIITRVSPRGRTCRRARSDRERNRRKA